MNLIQAIDAAQTAAYAADSDHLVGMINDEWAIADENDTGRCSAMALAPRFLVRGDGMGVAMTSAAVMLEMEKAGIEGDQDWANETTIYDLGDAKITVCGPEFDIS